jgi:hypothetical protein
MTRPRGGYIGFNVVPTTAAASGVWTLREAEAAIRAGTWPISEPLAAPNLTNSCNNGIISVVRTTVGDATAYDWEVSENGADWYYISLSPSTDTLYYAPLTYEGAAVTFRVRARTDQQTSDYRFSVAVLIGSCRYVPTGLTQTSCNDGFVRLEWTPAIPPEEPIVYGRQDYTVLYELQYSQTIEGEYTTYTRDDESLTSESDIENAAIAADADGEVYWRVRAITSHDSSLALGPEGPVESEWSEPVLVTCPYDQLEPP